MKRILAIISLFLCALSVHSQNYVFVLVDVSKSVKHSDLVAAKQALTDVLLGNQLSNSNVFGATIQDLQQFKIAQGDKLSVLKFGNQQTSLNIAPQPLTIQTIPADIFQVLNSFPTTPTDNNTYWKLAKAKVADYAVKNGIRGYKLYIISDENEDDFGPGGKPNYINQATLEMAEGYNTKANPAIEEPSVQVKISTTTQGFKLNFCPQIDVSKYASGGVVIPPASDTATVAPTITLTSFADGKKDKPKPTSSNAFTISWNCNCPTGTKFNVQLSEIGGTGYKDKKPNVQANSVKFSDVPSGKFRIVVTAINAKAATTFVETPAGSFGWVIFLLILLAAISALYYYWNKRRQEKIEVFATNKADDIFSGGNKGGTSGNSSSNSDYF
jgi:hypothetical protein